MARTAAISTRNLSPLPDVDGLRALLQSMAMLDAILSPDWEYRLYSFNSRWAKGEQMGSMRDGQGDDFHALFNAAGCFLKGFAHEAAMTPYNADPKRLWPGLTESVPAEFAACLKEPAFSIEDTTFCIWRRYSDTAWQRSEIKFPAGADPDGSASLLSPLDGKPETYQAWAEGYYEQPVKLAAVREIYEHRPQTTDLVTELNDEVTLKKLAADIKEIGYPAPRGKTA